MKTAVVTGATSMLGIATIKRLIENDIRVIAISRANSRRRDVIPQSDLVTFVGCDLSEMKNLSLEGVKGEVFFHFGWGFINHETRNNPELQNTNVEYTMDAIDLAHRLGCTRFLGAGSQAEYGYKDYLVDENAECTPGLAYGHAKLKAYNLGREKCREYGMDYIWTRTFSAYGVNDYTDTMAYYALECYLNHKTAQFSAGTQSWNFLFEEDAGEYFYRLGFYDESHFSKDLKEEGRIDCIVNIGNATSKPLKQYIEEIKIAFGEGFEYELAPETDHPPKGINPDVSRLIEITDYIPKYSFKEGMRLMKENCRVVYK